MSLFAFDKPLTEPQPTLWQRLWHTPNDKPGRDAYGYCADQGRRFGYREWAFHWCPSCHKFHTSCPVCGVPLEFNCIRCGEPLRGFEGDEECEGCRSLDGDDLAMVERFVTKGHTRHCAARMVWGDGGCEGCPGA